MPRRNFLLRLAYDGSGFFGWQRQKDDVRSVQAEVEAALGRLLGEAVSVTGAGRTDAGVHAEGQGASFHSRTVLSCGDIVAALVRELPRDISCSGCREVDPRFHARFRAKSKTYRYRFLMPGTATAAGPAVRTGLLVPEPLDIEAMSETAVAFKGEHDFRAFTNARGVDDCRRAIDDARVTVGEGTVDLYFTASGFLTNQVRIMAAAVLEAGKGRLGPKEIRSLLNGRERSAAPGMLPAQGLCLVDVRF